MEIDLPKAPFLVGIGGTTKPRSSTESALKIALEAAARSGARTHLFDGEFLVGLPHFGTRDLMEFEDGRTLVDTIRLADGIIIASPGFHGSISGLVKNAIDYLEETANDTRVYLDGIPVGLITTAYGWQAANSTLATLRSIVHALRGLPTPLGAAINCSGGIFPDGTCTDPSAAQQLELVGRQVTEFARLCRLRPGAQKPRPSRQGRASGTGRWNAAMALGFGPWDRTEE